MKKINKAYSLICLLLVCCLIVGLMFNAFIFNKTTSASAETYLDEESDLKKSEDVGGEIDPDEDDYNDFELSATELEAIEQLIESIEIDLSNNQTTIVESLLDQRALYEEQYETFDDEEEKSKIAGLIEAYDKSIDDFDTYKVIQEDIENSESNITPYLLTPGGGGLITGDTFTRPIVAAAVASVIAYFNNNGYVLASELLSHARSNSVPESIYSPNNRSLILSSNTYANIVNSNNTKGSAEFVKDGTTIGNDLFYALHHVTYSKSYSNQAIEIQDRYDYEFDHYEDFTTGVAVNLMVFAQSLGIITPYRLVIDFCTTASSVNAPVESVNIYNSRYLERVVTLGKREYKEYKVTFNKSGTQLIQTFGPKDAYLELYNSNGVKLSSNDDAGYSLNALISYYCYANTTYIIRVRFYSSSAHGEIKLAISPYFYNSMTKYEDLYAKEGTSWTLNTYINADKVDVNIFTPTKNRYYTLTTDKKDDTYYDLYMYLIDPRHTVEITSNNSSYYPSVYNDDGGKNLQPKISKTLASGVSYYIVVSKFSLPTEQIKYVLKIS